MKKAVLILSIISLIILFDGIVMAQTISGFEPPTDINSFDQIVTLVSDVVRWIYILFFIIAVAIIIFAAFTYLGAGDNPDNAVKARKMITYAAIAIAVALLAVSFRIIIENFLTGGGGVPSRTGGI